MDDTDDLIIGVDHRTARHTLDELEVHFEKIDQTLDSRGADRSFAEIDLVSWTEVGILLRVTYILDLSLLFLASS